MVSDLSQQVNPTAGGAPRQAIAGLMPPSVGEARIREVFPTVMARAGGVATLAKRLTQTYFLAPVGFLLLAPFFALKFAPGFCTRYTLTNRAVKVQRGLKPRVKAEVHLDKIDEVRFDKATFDDFYLSGDLEIVSGGQVVLRLPGVPEPESFRHSIVDAVSAWVPGKQMAPFVPASAPSAQA